MEFLTKKQTIQAIMKTTTERLAENLIHTISELEREKLILDGRIEQAQTTLANLRSFEQQEKLKDE